MQGLAEKTEKLFEGISKLSSLKGYTLIGGTALSLQINKRLSEDLDFCKWSVNLKKDKPTVDWPKIEKELATVGTIDSRDVLGFDQVNFVVSGVKVSFITKQDNLSPVKHPVKILQNIIAADIDALGAMKVEVILRRSEFRDYYDIYSILKEGRLLKELVTGASKYSNHLLKSRDALIFLSDGRKFRMNSTFHLLKPFYKIDNLGIEDYIKDAIKKEYPL
jgi:hypothetical protein